MGPHIRKRILITGASSGLGAGMARIWARQSRDLVLCARRVDMLQQLGDELLAAGASGAVLLLPLDVDDPDAVRETFAHASEALGGLDRVVANAGIASGGPIGSGFADYNRRAVVTNVIGVLNQAEVALEVFRVAGRGHLVLISSMAALRGLGGKANVYSATKAAVSNLGEGLRSELWGSPIKVSTIHPGYIRTAINSSNPQVKFARSLATGSKALVDAIEREPGKAYVPRVPWTAFSMPMRLLPLGLTRRVTG